MRTEDREPVPTDRRTLCTMTRRHDAFAMRRVAALGMAAAAGVWDAPARACEPAACTAGTFLPGTGTVPVNVPALVWYPAHAPGAATLPTLSFGSDPDLRFQRLLDDGTVQARLYEAQPQRDLTYFVRPITALMAGERYRMTGVSYCDRNAPRTVGEFFATAAAPLPTDLGALVTAPLDRGDLPVSTASGACSAVVRAAWIDVMVNPTPGATPWRDVFLFETYVDGAAWRPAASAGAAPPPGASWLGRGRDRLFTRCGAPDGGVLDPGAFAGLAEGDHTVEFRATLPGVRGVLVSSPLRIRLTCTDPPPDAAVPMDAAVPPDATGPAADAVEDATDAEVRGPLTTGSGCRCRAVPVQSPSPATAWGLGAVMSALALRARRGRPRSPRG